MINILYATVGTFLDTVVFNKSVYDLHKVSKRKRLQMYTLLYILLSILFAVVGDDIVFLRVYDRVQTNTNKIPISTPRKY